MRRCVRKSYGTAPRRQGGPQRDGGQRTRGHRVQALQGVEVCIYDQWGAKMPLKKEKMVEVGCDHFRVAAKESITQETRCWQATASTSAS